MSNVSRLTSFNYHSRLDRIRALLAEADVDVLLLPAGRDLLYFTGYEAVVSERMTLAVIPAFGEPLLLVPELEAPRVIPREDAFAVRPWSETEDPVRLAVDRLGSPKRAAVGDEMWSVFLLALQEGLPGTRFRPAAPLTSRLRITKSADEVELLRAAGAATDRVVARLADAAFSGRSERDLAEEIEGLTLAEGHDGRGFAIVASGPNAASPHHEPGTRPIRPGDTVVVDFGGRVEGYCSDTTRTFHVGEPDPEVREAYDVLRRAQRAAVAAVTPGVPAQDIDRAARGVITDAGYGEFFIHRTGHGIGLDVHEDPYLVEGNEDPIAAGMTFSVEPGIYVPGRFGMRIEDIVAVTADGADRLNRSSRSLRIVG